MSASIYGIAYESTATSKEILTILRKEPVKVSEHTYDADELYKVLCKDFRWEEPGKDSTMIWSDDYHNIHPVTIPSGKGGLYLEWNERPDIKTEVTAYILELNS